MAGERRYRAPREYGAWVEGQFFEPGQLLPSGTTEYNVVGIEEVEGVRRGFRTFRQTVAVGTSFADIQDEFGAMAFELEELKQSL